MKLIDSKVLENGTTEYIWEKEDGTTEVTIGQKDQRNKLYFDAPYTGFDLINTIPKFVTKITLVKPEVRKRPEFNMTKEALLHKERYFEDKYESREAWTKIQKDLYILELEELVKYYENKESKY